MKKKKKSTKKNNRIVLSSRGTPTPNTERYCMRWAKIGTDSKIVTVSYRLICIVNMNKRTNDTNQLLLGVLACLPAYICCAVVDFVVVVTVAHSFTLIK